MSLGSRLHVTLSKELTQDMLSLPRRYTLTHSDVTGELYLTIAKEYNLEQISGWYTRFMRDEVQAEWKTENGLYSLHLYCHLSGGLVFGTAGMRYGIFKQHLPLVLQALREGDGVLFQAQPELENAPVRIHFAARQKRFQITEEWGKIGEYLAEETDLFVQAR